MKISRKKGSFRLGRIFAGSLASKLDLHPSGPEGLRMVAEDRVIDIAREFLARCDDNPHEVAFLSQVVEAHTRAHGLSQRVIDEIHRLHGARRERRGEPNHDPHPKRGMPRGIKV